MTQTILLSAYACEPGKGSEPAVGWNWVCELAKQGHSVHVITRSNNKEAIEKALPSLAHSENIHFIYYDLPKVFLLAKKKLPFGVQLYYGLWQIGIYKLARKIVQKIKFDYIHHVTFVGIRQPSYLALLNVPFVFGPVAGGESAPYQLRKHYSFRQKLADFSRDMLNYLVKLDPRMWIVFHKSKHIFVTSQQTKNLVPSRYHHKTSVQLAIGLNETTEPNSKLILKEKTKPLKVLFVGRFLEWKGMGMGIQAFATFNKQHPETRLTMVGHGKAKDIWKKQAIDLGVNEKIDWIEWLPKDKVSELYTSHDVFLFPSLHDSGGMVVLEAMSFGLPVICLDLGGPGQIVNQSTGYKILIDENTTEEQVCNKLTTALEHFTDDEVRKQVYEKSNNSKQSYTWQFLVNKIQAKFLDKL